MEENPSNIERIIELTMKGYAKSLVHLYYDYIIIKEKVP